MRAFSADLRERVLWAAESRQESQEKVAACFAVGLSTLKSWLTRSRQQGRAAALLARPHPGRSPKLNPGQRAALATHVRGPGFDATLQELQEFVRERCEGVRMSVSALSRLLTAMELPRKKRRSPPPSATSASASAGEQSARKKQPPGSSTLRRPSSWTRPASTGR